MTSYHFVVTFIVSVGFHLITTTKAECGPNEVARTASNDKSDSCPVPAGQTPYFPADNACVCNLMFKRAANGTCIPSRECPPIPCPENEEFVSCPVCSEDCSNKSEDGRRCRFVGKIGTTVICQPACRCVDNYWRDGSKKCVPYNKCPVQCGPNEVARTESNVKSDSCPVPEGQAPYSPNNSACVCDPLFKRAANGTCIPSRECPPIPCPENEEFVSCPVCSEDCSNKSADGKRCRYKYKIGTTVICQPACRCVDNYWRDGSKKCVPYNKCPVECGPNEVARTESNDKSDSCPVPEGQAPYNPNNSACVCNLLFKRAANGTCIPSRECPPIPCPENEEFVSCPVCSEDCSNKSVDGKRCRYRFNALFTVICEPACRCIDNYWRDECNNCVPYDECPLFSTYR